MSSIESISVNFVYSEVLSVISQQVYTIQYAIRQREALFEFNGKNIPLDNRFGVFITMNPTYAGRTELPDNLKALFRPITMMVPDYELIAEIMFMSDGKICIQAFIMPKFWETK